MADARDAFINQELAAVSVLIHREQKKVAHQRCSTPRSKLSKWCLEVALIVYCLMSYDFRLAILWLKRSPRKGKPLKDDVTDEEILNDLEDGFLAFDEVKLMSYVDPSTSTLSKTALDTAVTFTTEFKLAEQIWKANVTEGAVSRPPTLVREYNRLLDEEPGAGLKSRQSYYFLNSTKKWAGRFRKRMHCKYGKVNYAGKKIPKEELQEKASRSSFLGGGKSPPQQPRIFRSWGAVFLLHCFGIFWVQGLRVLTPVLVQNATPELGSPWLKPWPRDCHFQY